MPSLETFRPEKGRVVARTDVPSRYKWDLTAICGNPAEWQSAYDQLDASIDAFKQFQGTLSQGPGRLLEAFRAMDAMGALSYRVWYYASLQYDEDQRNNEHNARRQ